MKQSGIKQAARKALFRQADVPRLARTARTGGDCGKAGGQDFEQLGAGGAGEGGGGLRLIGIVSPDFHIGRQPRFASPSLNLASKFKKDWDCLNKLIDCL